MHVQGATAGACWAQAVLMLALLLTACKSPCRVLLLGNAEFKPGPGQGCWDRPERPAMAGAALGAAQCPWSGCNAQEHGMVRGRDMGMTLLSP